MKIIFLILSVLFNFILFAQQKGVSPLEKDKGKTGQTYAVVVGISDYRDDRIPDLHFAHKDAEAFNAYLQSPAGGQLSEANIRLLTNEKATTGQVVAAMGWLVEACRSGDKAIIYFSGHGDVERISKFQRGYLLTHDSPPNNYMAGAFPVFGLQDIITTLSEMGVQVIMVSDACRAGKLAGSNAGGPQATSASLAQQFANEIKILSCHPEEFSLEGEQWGGGRGCFSFHFLDGLYGLADDNGDAQINLLEIGRYLEDKVMAEAAPHSQIPMTVGSKSSVVAQVDKNYLEKLLAEKKGQQPVLAGIESKGVKDLILENADTNIQRLYQDFLAAIENGHLMEPQGQSANDYYEILIQEKSIEKLHGFMQRNFAAALQDESQIAINDLLDSDRDYLVKRWFIKEKYPFPKYLERAMELLGKDHYLYHTLNVRRLYFIGWNQILSMDRTDLKKDSIFLQNSINNFRSALQVDSNSAFLLEGLSHAYRGPYFNDLEASLILLKKAINIAPTWPIPYYEMGNLFQEQQKLDSAEFWYLKSLEIDSTFFGAYSRLAAIYRQTNNFYKAEAVLKKAIELDTSDYYSFFSLSALYISQKKYDQAIGQYLKLYKILPDEDEVWYKYHVNLLDTYLAAGYPNKAIGFSRRMLEMKKDSLVAYAGLGFSYLYKKDFEKAMQNFELSANLSKDSFYQYLCFSGYHAMEGNIDQSLQLLEKALMEGNRDFYVIQTNKSFDPLRENSEFKKIMKKYFPKRFTEN